jgi:hypothetical protein
MQVFICWSGDPSRAIAAAFTDWLPRVIQACESFMSDDTPKGTAWFDALTQRLYNADFGIVCVTPENADSSWLNFEAGAMWRGLNRSSVAPIVVNMKKHDLRPPLGQLQATEFEFGDIRQLLSTINSGLPDDAKLDSNRLDEAHRIQWPALEAKVTEAVSAKPATYPQRPEHELLEEVLNLLRSQPYNPVFPSQVFGAKILGDTTLLSKADNVPRRSFQGFAQAREVQGAVIGEAQAIIGPKVASLTVDPRAQHMIITLQPGIGLSTIEMARLRLLGIDILIEHPKLWDQVDPDT